MKTLKKIKLNGLNDAELKDREMDALNLKVVCELSNSEIAQKLNVSETVVRQRLFQARKSILGQHRTKSTN